MSTKVAILGAGANGAAIGADMVRAGHDVTLIEQWPAHVEAMKERGVTVTNAADGSVEHTPVRAHHLCEVAELRDTFDLVYIVVKAYDTRWASELITSVIHDDSLVIGLQNGMRTDDVRAAVGDARGLGAVIEMGSNLRGPGDIERHVPREKSWFAVGGGHARSEEAAQVLRAAGTVEVIDDIETAKWMKLVLNASQLVPSGILDTPIVEAASRDDYRPIMKAAGLEALRAAAARGVGIQPIMGLTDVDPGDPEKFLDDIFELLLNGFALPTTKATMLYDWRHGRRSEATDINGLVVDVLGADAAPVNAAFTAVAHRIEAGEATPGEHARELLSAYLAEFEGVRA